MESEVGFAHGTEVITLRARTSGDRTEYDLPRRIPAGESATAEFSRIVEIGRIWEMVPAKLYRPTDHPHYVQHHPPRSTAVSIASVALPHLRAVGVFEDTGGARGRHREQTHLAQLLLATAHELRAVGPAFGIAFFVGPTLWVVLYRDGGLVYAGAHAAGAETDAVFYLAALYNHFGLRRSACPLYVGGGIGPEGSVYRQLLIYFDAELLATAIDALDSAPADVNLLRAFGRTLRLDPTPL